MPGLLSRPNTTRLIALGCQDPKSGSTSHLETPSHVILHSFITFKMSATDQDELFDNFTVLLVVFRLHLLFFINISRQRRQQNTAPAQTAPVRVGQTGSHPSR